MLVRHEKPPLMVYLIWPEYTRLAKEIAIAATYGSSIDRAAVRASRKRWRDLNGPAIPTICRASDDDTGFIRAR